MKGPTNTRDDPITDDDLGVTAEYESVWYDSGDDREATYPLGTIRLEGQRLRRDDAVELAQTLLALAEEGG